LLGRRTYEIFAAYWPHQNDEIARVFNAVNKYVVASPGTPTPWANSQLLEGDVVEAVRALKQTDGRDLLIQGSSQVIHALLAADLIDQMTMLTFPVVLGDGKRLFDFGSQPRGWTPLETEVTGKGVVVSAYRLGGDVPTGSFAGDEVSEARQARRDRARSEG
ncbi:dihydrofolate reductase family protein, partial [Brevundimonas sp.]|uniref:dihydrofolate reductase family protein n=1 Tax=Brevundimonas sp. TaxID=1871086 RepID=UPI0035B29B70